MKKNILIIIILFLIVSAIFSQDQYLEKGNTFLSNQEYDKAEEIFKEAIESDQENLIYPCQLALVYIQQTHYSKAQIILSEVLKKDSNNIAAIWYSGINYFHKGNDNQAILMFEKIIPLLDKKSGQYYSSNWFIGKCYSNLLKTSGINYQETDRMFECYEEYLRFQPNAEDAEEIKEYIERKKKRRPPRNVLNWIDL